MSVFVDDSIDTMERLNHAILAEESIANYIDMLEKEANAKMPEEDKAWLYAAGKKIFNKYYTNDKLSIAVASVEDNKKLSNYINKLQDTMSKMFAHILISDFKTYILEKQLQGE